MRHALDAVRRALELPMLPELRAELSRVEGILLRVLAQL